MIKEIFLNSETSQHFSVQRQKQKHQNNVWNMLKVSSTDKIDRRNNCKVNTQPAFTCTKSTTIKPLEQCVKSVQK